MNGVAKWLEAIERAIGGGPGGTKRIKTFRWLLLLGCAGVALILLNSFLNIKQLNPDHTAGQVGGAPVLAGDNEQQAFIGGKEPLEGFAAIERPLEQRLKELLEQIIGVGSVEVLITVDSTEEIVVERNESSSQQVTDETDKSGGKRHVTSVTSDGQVVLHEVGGSQSPIITKRIQPRIRGVVIVALGAENATVRKIIVDAVQKGLGVSFNRISVVPRKQR